VMGMRVRLIPSSSRKHTAGRAYALSRQAPSPCHRHASLGHADLRSSRLPGQL
jgi:hypothetical protein